jgi:hypothetical protein
VANGGKLLAMVAGRSAPKGLLSVAVAIGTAAAAGLGAPKVVWLLLLALSILLGLWALLGFLWHHHDRAPPETNRPKTAVANVVGPVASPSLEKLAIDAGQYQTNLSGRPEVVVFPRLRITNGTDSAVSLTLRPWQRLAGPHGLQSTGGNVVEAVPLVADENSELSDPLNLDPGKGVVVAAAFKWPYGEQDRQHVADGGVIGLSHYIEVYDHISGGRIEFSGRWPESLQRNPGVP